MSSSESIEVAVERFLAHKRAHDRKYLSEQSELRLLIAFAAEHGVTGLEQLTPALLEDFSVRGRGHDRGASTTSSASSAACWTGRSASS